MNKEQTNAQAGCRHATDPWEIIEHKSGRGEAQSDRRGGWRQLAGLALLSF